MYHNAVLSVVLRPPRSVSQTKVPRFSNRIPAYALSSVDFSTYLFVDLPFLKTCRRKMSSLVHFRMRINSFWPNGLYRMNVCEVHLVVFNFRHRLDNFLLAGFFHRGDFVSSSFHYSIHQEKREFYRFPVSPSGEYKPGVCNFRSK